MLNGRIWKLCFLTTYYIMMLNSYFTLEVKEVDYSFANFIARPTFFNWRMKWCIFTSYSSLWQKLISIRNYIMQLFRIWFIELYHYFRVLSYDISIHIYQILNCNLYFLKCSKMASLRIVDEFSYSDELIASNSYGPLTNFFCLSNVQFCTSVL